ncbi:MAG: hypothetical protein QJR02_03540 [Sinobacteraceae bacterium]|nr:hypothetical protein [Nevskiaceae bacterium]
MNAPVVIFADTPGWHGRRLRRAFAARGVAARRVPLRDCGFDAAAPHGLRIPGFARRLPRAAFVRGISAGSLEEIVLRLEVLHALKSLGVPVYNPPRALELAVNKGMTAFVLARAGVPTPPAWTVAEPAAARRCAIAECARGHELVLKPVFGAQGAGLRRIAAPHELPPPEAVGGVYHLQRYVGPGADGGEDYRVLVVNGAARAAMTRRGRGWIHNVAQGARCRPAPDDPLLHEYAERAAAALGLDYAGVDLIRDRDGRLTVLEVNGIPAWRGLQSQTAQDIAQILADDLLARHLPPARRCA